MGGSGFAKQLQRMGKEFRLQRQMQRRANRTHGPGEGIYRDQAGRRVVIVNDSKNVATSSVVDATKRSHDDKKQENQSQQREQAASIAVTQAARDARADERRGLVAKIVSAVREGRSKVDVSSKRS